MDAKNYCRSIEVELYGWKARMYKEKIHASVEELHKNIADMERMIEQLQTECPLEFGSEKKQIEETSADMKKKYEDAMSAVLQF
jgi:methylaspartate ammonia-lyase